MEKRILNSTLADTEMIFRFYDQAIAFQKTVFHKQWEGFDKDLVETEIKENRQWKILIEDEVACIFAITFSDALFWKERDKDPSIYIHRIVTNPKFRGQNLVKAIVDWGKEYAKANGKTHVRLDTWGDNPKLKEHYVKNGFTFLEVMDLDNTAGLPKHYKGTLALFELKV